MPETYMNYLDSPLGLIEIVGNHKAVTGLNFVHQKRVSHPVSNTVVDAALDQLKEYLNGTRTAFSIPLELQGTFFQKQVWQALLKVGYGETVSYKHIAEAIGNPRAVRAVGAANGKNPVAIIVPCHRIIGSNGSMTGYSSGIWRKEWLLRHEGCL
jgi:methylated-DNA-[protein]-cysteine S-methyltransferase